MVATGTVEKFSWTVVAVGGASNRIAAKAASKSGVISNVAVSGGGYSGTVEGFYGTGDHWNERFDSFGHLQEIRPQVAVWVENAEVMARVNANLAEFDSQVINGLMFSPKIAATAAFESVNVLYSAYEYGTGQATATETLFNIVPGMRGLGRVDVAKIAAAETKLTGGTFDLGVSGSQYTVRAPTLAGFEGATGTVNTRAFVVHGNSKLSPKPATLYELYQVGDDGARTFLKYGISQNPAKRYSQTFMADKRIFPVATGSRADMLTLERQMVTQNPGPLNFEPWAVKARGGQ